MEKEKELINKIVEYQNYLKEKYGFDWDNVNGVIDKLKEETIELKLAIDEKNDQKIKEEFGDLLITVINLSRFLNLDIISVLEESFKKFKNRVKRMEEEAKKENLSLEKLNIYELDKLWEKIKDEKII